MVAHKTKVFSIRKRHGLKKMKKLWFRNALFVNDIVLLGTTICLKSEKTVNVIFQWAYAQVFHRIVHTYLPYTYSRCSNIFSCEVSTIQYQNTSTQSPSHTYAAKLRQKKPFFCHFVFFHPPPTSVVRHLPINTGLFRKNYRRKNVTLTLAL